MPLVKFTTIYAPYNAGETAGFDLATANRLVAEGVAAAVDFTPTSSTEAQALQSFQGGSAATEQTDQAYHLAGDVGQPGEIPGGQ